MHAEIEPRHWVVAEFPSGDSLLDAVRKARENGNTDIDTHTPFPIRGSEEALGLKRSKIPLIALIGGVTGACVGLGLQWFCNAFTGGIDLIHGWPLNIANRPPFSPPAAIPICFECMVLFSALSIFTGLLALSKLPQPYHPAFDTEAFRSHSTDGYWLSIQVAKEKNPQDVAGEIRDLGASQVEVVQEQVDE